MSTDVLKSTTVTASSDATEKRSALVGKYTVNDLFDAGEAFFGALGGAALAAEFRGEFITTSGNPCEQQLPEPSKTSTGLLILSFLSK